MASRALLRSQITEAWRLAMTKDYAAERINSERSLQAALWSRLNKTLAERLPPKSHRIFIEPRMTVAGKLLYPDIVICNTRQVVGIIELKYKPRTRAGWREDLNKFRAIADCKSLITVSHDRYRGAGSRAQPYSLAKTVLYVWAGVHAESALELAEHAGKLAPNFLALHAETVEGKPPRLIVSRSTSREAKLPSNGGGVSVTP
jgi:hypothetical protein